MSETSKSTGLVQVSRARLPTGCCRWRTLAPPGPISANTEGCIGAGSTASTWSPRRTRAREIPPGELPSSRAFFPSQNASSSHPAQASACSTLSQAREGDSGGRVTRAKPPGLTGLNPHPPTPTGASRGHVGRSVRVGRLGFNRRIHSACGSLRGWSLESGASPVGAVQHIIKPAADDDVLVKGGVRHESGVCQSVTTSNKDTSRPKVAWRTAPTPSRSMLASMGRGKPRR